MSSDNLFELDTKGICLLCLRKCTSSDKNEGLSCSFSSPSTSTSPGEKERIFQSFKVLMRYLNIDLLEQCNFSREFLQTVDGVQREVGMLVRMCSSCLGACQEFNQVYQRFEMIRLQLDECVLDLHRRMQGGDRDKGRVREYERRMKGEGGSGGGWNPGRLFHASIADNLRKETLRKCSLRVDKLIPRVTISRQVNYDNPATDNQSSYPPPSSPSAEDPICVITETKGDLENDDEFQGPLSMLKLETIYSSGYVNGDGGGGDHDPDTLLLEEEEELEEDIKYDPFSTGNLSPDWTPSSSNAFPCNRCPKKSFTSSSNLRLHQVTVHTLEAFADRVPDGTTQTQLKKAINHCVKQHTRVPDPRDPNGRPHRYSCGFCSKDLRDTFNLKVHIFDNHFDQIVIALADSSIVSYTAAAASASVERKHPVKTVKTTKSKTKPKPKSKKTVALKRTGGKVRRRGAAYNGPTHKCPICRKEFTVLACMKRHYKVFHTREGGNQFRCPFCDKVFMTRFNMSVHINTVHLYEAHADKLPPNISEKQLKATILAISKEQNREWAPNRTKAGVRCAYCGKINTDAFFFKTHLVEKHFDEVVMPRLNTIEFTNGTDALLKEDGDSNSSHLLQMEGHEMMEEDEEQELPIDSFMSSEFDYVLMDGTTASTGGGDQEEQEQHEEEEDEENVTTDHHQPEEGTEEEGTGDVPPDLDLYD